MAWSPPAHKRRIVWVSAPGDYATFNSNQTPDGTKQADPVGELFLPDAAKGPYKSRLRQSSGQTFDKHGHLPSAYHSLVDKIRRMEPTGSKVERADFRRSARSLLFDFHH